MNVSAVIVTRGDVDLSPVLDSLPRDWQKVIWDNSVREDLAVYGRYAAIEECEHDLIYVQDDDCVLPPESITQLVISATSATAEITLKAYGGEEIIVPPKIVANMPQRFRDTGFYDDHCLVGFGAIFHRDLPERAFDRYRAAVKWDWTIDSFPRTCDIVFTALTPRILVDLPYRDLSHAHAENRMWKQPQHVEERTRMLDLVRQVRDA